MKILKKIWYVLTKPWYFVSHDDYHNFMKLEDKLKHEQEYTDAWKQAALYFYKELRKKDEDHNDS